MHTRNIHMRSDRIRLRRDHVLSFLASLRGSKSKGNENQQE